MIVRIASALAATSLALAGVPAVAAAEDWAPLAEDEDGALYDYDRVSLRKVGSVVQVWVRNDFRPAKVEPGAPRIAKTFEEIDCANARIRILQAADLDESGKEIRSYAVSEHQRRWLAIEPGSLAAVKSEVLCV